MKHFYFLIAFDVIILKFCSQGQMHPYFSFSLADKKNKRKLSIRQNHYEVQRTKGLKWLLSRKTDQSEFGMALSNCTQLAFFFQILFLFSTGLKLFTEFFRQDNFERAKRRSCFLKTIARKNNIAVKLNHVIFSR